MTEKIALKVARVSSASLTYTEFFRQVISGKGINHLVISIVPDSTALTYGRVNIRIGDVIVFTALRLEAVMTIEFPHLERGVYPQFKQGEEILVEYATTDTAQTVAFNMLVQISQVLE